MNGEIVIQDVLQAAMGGSSYEDLVGDKILSPQSFQQNRPYLTKIIDVFAQSN